MGPGVVEDERAGVAGFGEWAVDAEDGDLIFEVDRAAVDVDDAVEADVDDGTEGEASGAAVFRDRLVEECRDGRIDGVAESHDLGGGGVRIVKRRDGGVHMVDSAAEDQVLVVGQSGNAASLVRWSAVGGTRLHDGVVDVGGVCICEDVIVAEDTTVVRYVD